MLSYLLLCQELSEPEINADLAYLKKIVGQTSDSMIVPTYIDEMVEA